MPRLRLRGLHPIVAEAVWLDEPRLILESPDIEAHWNQRRSANCSAMPTLLISSRCKKRHSCSKAWSRLIWIPTCLYMISASSWAAD